MKKIILLTSLCLAGLCLPQSASGQSGNVKTDPRALVVWHTENDPATHARFRKVGDAFKRETGREVVYEYIPWAQLSKRLFTSLESGDEALLPDITHLEPYMAYSLFRQSALEDISDVVGAIDKRSPIRPQVATLQQFDDRYYGLAQHVGVSFILYRQDHLDIIGAVAPKTWDEFFDVCAKLKANSKSADYAPVTAPGVSPFFLEIIFNELLNSAGGKIISGSPPKIKLDNPEVEKALATIKRMADFAGIARFKRTEYLEQFRSLEAGKATFVMFAGARAFRVFEENGPSATPAIYRTLEPPAFGQRRSYTSLDCEPFVVMQRTDKVRIRDSKKWMEVFFRHEYREFCESVPIQLMPIFPALDAAYEKNPSVTKWRPWYDQAKRMIDTDRAVPYFQQVGAPAEVDFLFNFHNRGIVYEMILEVVNGAEIKEAIQHAQEKADLVVKNERRNRSP